ncbi:hypothetical protein CMQ_4873 [Grosmannia clavigera kw1407]|uniref:Uncharacterized protein n=1 Tax=Grosmannia clavigera (strain kw1407 / UAMH 11150) TaxID=655863 RepID=F0XTR0_GROCL|nr:uncharacterized protein CMQ_4873 [Grosmannia clavigera kw1407]EFW99021.1 hypothetical protein CMQ_4873 [Grosmannia clavigera kw1407]
MAVLTRAASKTSGGQSKPARMQTQIQIQMPPRPPRRQDNARRSIRSRCPTPYPQDVPPVQASIETDVDDEEKQQATTAMLANRHDASRAKSKSMPADENVTMAPTHRRSRRSCRSHDGHDGLNKNAALTRRRSKVARRTQPESQEWQDKTVLRSRGAALFARPGLLPGSVVGGPVLRASV